MKNRIKQITKFIAVYALLMLGSCAEELYKDEPLNQSKIKVSYVNEIALENNNLLMEKINNSALFKKNAMNRIITDTLTGYSIDTDKVKYIVGENFNSYTFEIVTPQQTYLDNLVLISKNGGEYKPYAMRYTLTEEEKLKLYTDEYIDFTNKCKAAEIDNGETLEEILSKYSYNEDCNMVYTWQETITITPCTIDGCLNSPWASFSYGHVLIGTLVCSDGGSSGGDMGSGDIGTSPHGGGGDLPPNPCLSLKKHLSTTTGVKLKAPSMVPALKLTLNQTGENGRSLVKNNNIYTTPTLAPTPGLAIIASYGAKIFGSVHTHPYPSGAPMFSWTDVYSLVLFNNNVEASLIPEVVIFLVCKDANGADQLYALKIDDEAVFADALTADIQANISPSELEGIPEEQKTEKMLGLMDKELTLDYQRSPDKELGFLKKFSNFGISLYKANSTMTNWSKLTLQNPASTNPTVLPIPCK